MGAPVAYAHSPNEKVHRADVDSLLAPVPGTCFKNYRMRIKDREFNEFISEQSIQERVRGAGPAN